MKTIRVALTGVGNRALPKKPENSNWTGWVELIRQTEGLELVAAYDPSDEARHRIIERKILAENCVYSDFDEMMARSDCDALFVVNPAEYHAAAIRKAIESHMHVLVEKPVVNDCAEGKRLVMAANAAGVVVSVAQNWRTKDVGYYLRQAVQEGRLGRIGHVFFRYVRDRENPNYPAYIFEEKYPLLYAMGIHHFDLIRYVLNDEFESVRGQSFKPPWSLYRSDTGLNLFLRTRGGVDVVYSGTISSHNRGLLQESLLVEGENGSLFNESDWSEPPLWYYPAGSKERANLVPGKVDSSVAGQYNKSDLRILENFRDSILRSEKPICTLNDAINSVLTIEACHIACQTGKETFIEVLA